jgi:hypothetical protein
MKSMCGSVGFSTEGKIMTLCSVRVRNITNVDQFFIIPIHLAGALCPNGMRWLTISRARRFAWFRTPASID